MENLVISLVILAIVSISVRKIIIEKRKGVKCIGCPYSGSDKSNCNCNQNIID